MPLLLCLPSLSALAYRLQADLIAFVTLLARRLILMRWKSPTLPSHTLWMKEMFNNLQLEKIWYSLKLFQEISEDEGAFCLLTQRNSPFQLPPNKIPCCLIMFYSYLQGEVSIFIDVCQLWLSRLLVKLNWWSGKCRLHSSHLDLLSLRAISEQKMERKREAKLWLIIWCSCVHTEVFVFVTYHLDFISAAVFASPLLSCMFSMLWHIFNLTSNFFPRIHFLSLTIFF